MGMKEEDLSVWEEKQQTIVSIHTQFSKTKASLPQNRHCGRRQQRQPQLYFFRRLFFLGSWFSAVCSAALLWRGSERVAVQTVIVFV